MTILELIGYAIGAAALVGICWMAWQAGLLARGQDYTNSDMQDDDRRAAEIIEASRPAELRPHVRAGSAWGKEVAK